MWPSPGLSYAALRRLRPAECGEEQCRTGLPRAFRVGAGASSWWPEIFAPGAVLSLEHDFVICINMLGSCYGSTGPGSVNPDTGETYGARFSPGLQSATMSGRRPSSSIPSVFGACGW